jgi:hypothetical protein
LNVLFDRGQLSYKITVFALKGTKMIDARLIKPWKTIDLSAKLAIALPGFSITVPAYAANSLLTLRRSQKLFISQFIAKADIPAFLEKLQLQWSGMNCEI